VSKPYLRELLDQLALVKEKLAGIHVPTGPLAGPLPPELKARRERLIQRKHEIEESIINYRPPKP